MIDFSFFDVNEFVAYNRTIDEIKDEIGADRLIYQSLDDLISSVKKYNRDIEHFDCSCFNGEYITRSVTTEYLNNLKEIRKSNR